MQDILDPINAYTGEHAWIVKISVLMLLAMVLDFTQRMLLRSLRAKADATANPWDDALLEALRAPLSLMIWVQAISLAVEIVAHERGVDSGLFDLADPLRYVGVIASLAWFLLRAIRELETRYIRRSVSSEREDKLDRATIEALAKLLRLGVMVTAGIVALQTMGFSLSGVLAFGGIGGIAIGFAAKDLLANFFGGLMIYLDRPFAVGDWIRSPDREIEGTVEYIGWRLTRIRTFEQRPLYVPNSIFTGIAVENPSRMSHRRIYETLGIRYDDVAQMQAIVAGVEAMLREHVEIDTRQTLMVNFNSFAPSSLDFFIYAFTHTTDWVRYHQIKQDVMLRIAEIIERHGAEIAFPTSTLHLRGELPPGAPQTQLQESEHG